MSDQIKVFEANYTVTDDVAIHFMGPEITPVLSTPSMINWMEHTCRDNVQPSLNPGDDTAAVALSQAVLIELAVRSSSRTWWVIGRRTEGGEGGLSLAITKVLWQTSR